MMRLVMLAKVFSRAVEASFHRGDTRVEGFCNFCVAATFLHKREQRPILRTKLGKSMPQRVEFFGIHRTRRLRNIFVFLPEREKNAPQLLPPQLVDAGVPREAEQPRFELRRRLQAIDGAHHLDEHLLREIFDVITSTSHGVYESSDPMLVADDELPLGRFVAFLCPPHEVGQRIG
jgi:hypothetical protein